MSEQTKLSFSLTSKSTPATEGLRHLLHRSHWAQPKPDHWQMAKSCCAMLHFSGLPTSFGMPSSSSSFFTRGGGAAAPQRPLCICGGDEPGRKRWTPPVRRRPSTRPAEGLPFAGEHGPLPGPRARFGLSRYEL